MNLIDRYQKRIAEQLDTVCKTQHDACVEVGKAIADCVAKGGAVHVYDTGHIIDSELIYRGGGVLFLKAFKFNLSIDDCVRKRDRSSVDKDMTGFAAYALKKSEALPGDILIIGSVSGKSVNVVDLAIEAKKFGMTVVAVTSLAYSSEVESLHPSGKRLFECADYVIDNCAPAAEAMLEIEGVDVRFGAASGISAAVALWSVCAQAIESLMQDYNIVPSILMSENFADGPEYNAKLRERYEKLGY